MGTSWNTNTNIYIYNKGGWKYVMHNSQILFTPLWYNVASSHNVHTFDDLYNIKLFKIHICSFINVAFDENYSYTVQRFTLTTKRIWHCSKSDTYWQWDQIGCHWLIVAINRSTEQGDTEIIQITVFKDSTGVDPQVRDIRTDKDT